MKIELQEKVKGLDAKRKGILDMEDMSKSRKMKELFKLGLEVKEIAKLLDVRYNFVYNVISNLVIIEGIEVVTSTKDSKKDKVFELFTAGKTAKEVAVELKTNINYVYKLKKEWEALEAAKKEGQQAEAAVTE